MMYPVEITFDFFDTENSDIKLLHNSQECKPNHNRFIFKTEITLPNTLQFRMIGKHSRKHDTFVDKNGKILHDRYIKITDIRLNNLQPNDLYLQRWPILLHSDNQTLHTNYIGHNGYIDLIFEANNPIQWILRSNIYQDNTWQDDSMNNFVA